MTGLEVAISIDFAIDTANTVREYYYKFYKYLSLENVLRAAQL